MNKLIVFSGDSWTMGCDAKPGNGFFDLLKADEDFKSFSLANLGYGSNTCIQVVNSIICYKRVPDIVVLNMGVNAWHLIGLEEFINVAKDYLSDEEIKQLTKDFRFKHRLPIWFTRLKIYKLYYYLSNSKNKKICIDIKEMNKRLGSPAFWEIYCDFQKFSPNYTLMEQMMPEILNKADTLSLDQKFYFVGSNVGFNTEKMEEILRKANLFYPDKLKVFPYDVYQRLDFKDKRDLPLFENLMGWSFRLLDRWSKRNNVVVFIQTYPDIKKEKFGDLDFEKVNEAIKYHTKICGFRLIDHNIDGVDWKEYATPWHVNNKGHMVMKEKIKKELLVYLNDMKKS